MKKLIGLVILSIGLPMVASAETPGFAGHTMQIDLPTGDSLEFEFNTDGTFTASNGASGTWTFANDTLCYTPDGAAEACGPLPGDKQVGDTWVGEAWDGSGDVTVTIK